MRFTSFGYSNFLDLSSWIISLLFGNIISMPFTSFVLDGSGGEDAGSYHLTDPVYTR